MMISWSVVSAFIVGGTLAGAIAYLWGYIDGHKRGYRDCWSDQHSEDDEQLEFGQ